MDPLEAIFSAMRVESAIYARLEARAPWGISFGTSTHARFAVVVQGHCWLSAAGSAQPIALAGGDCFIVKGDARFVLQDELGSPVQDCGQVFGASAPDTATVGGEGARTAVVAGRFAFDSASGKPLMSLLPPVLHIPMDNGRAGLLQSTLQLIALETAEQSMGARVVVNRLADVLFVQAVRAYCGSDACPRTGWLAAYADRRLGGALRALHADIGKSWTVQSLASAAGMSRSAFAHHFRNVLGDTPLNYLTRWRMYHAKSLLRQSKLTLTEIADRVGYETDGSFNRAFRRAVGVTPGDYRRHPAGTTPTRPEGEVVQTFREEGCRGDALIAHNKTRLPDQR